MGFLQCVGDEGVIEGVDEVRIFAHLQAQLPVREHLERLREPEQVRHQHRTVG